MIKRLLTPELVITLQQLEGIGNKTILSKIGENTSAPISTLDELSSLLTTIKGKKFESISNYDLIEANKCAKRIIAHAEEEAHRYYHILRFFIPGDFAELQK